MIGYRIHPASRTIKSLLTEAGMYSVQWWDGERVDGVSVCATLDELRRYAESRGCLIGPRDRVVECEGEESTGPCPDEGWHHPLLYPERARSLGNAARLLGLPVATPEQRARQRAEQRRTAAALADLDD